MEFLESARRILAVDSTPSHGTVDIMSVAGELCRSAGLTLDIQEGVRGGLSQQNLIARFSEQRPPEEVLFMSHLDTVDPGSYSLWTMTDNNPFNASIRDGKIYGLGAADCKLDFLCKLEALKRFKGKTFRRPPVLVGTYGEELGLMGTRQLLKEKKVNARQAVVGAPSELGIVYACNGIVILDLRIPYSKEEWAYVNRHNESESTSSHSRIFKGLAVHSSKPHLGENAILKMIRYLDQLPDTVAVIGVDGGTAFNVVPDQAVLELDIHASIQDSMKKKLVLIVNELENIATDFINYPAPDFTPSIPTHNLSPIRTVGDAVLMTISMRVPSSVSEELLRSWQERLSAVCDKLGVDVRVNQFLPPAKVSLDSELMVHAKAALQKTNGTAEFRTVSATNETAVLANRGIECIAFGPGKGAGNSHQPNEFNLLSQMETAREFYAQLIERLCL